VIVNIAAIIAWIAIARRRQLRERATWTDGVIGCVTSFLDTFGALLTRGCSGPDARRPARHAVAFPLIKTIGEHLALMRWLVIVVILYAAVSMLRSARAPMVELAQAGIELPR
jgi:hypothetical protein